MIAPARHLLVLSMLVDTLGSGLVVPFELLFGIDLVGLTLVETGVALTVGTGLAIAVGPVAGAAVDRIGPLRVVVVANAAAIVGCLGLLAADGVLAFGLVAFVLAAAARAFWAAYAPLTAGFVEATELETWFGRFRAARYAGIATGAALSSFALLAGRDTGLRVVLIADALSYLLAIGLYLVAARRRGAVSAAADRASPSAPGEGYRAALGDRANVVTAALNVVCTLVIIVPFIALPVFTLDQLGLPAWVPGALVALGTLAVAIPTSFAGRLGRGRPRLRLLAVAACLWAIGAALIATGATIAGVALAMLPLGIVVMGLGEAIYAPTADALPLALAPPGLTGRYSALHQLAWGISGTIAPLMTALLLIQATQAVWIVLTMMSVLTAFAYHALERRFGIRAGVSGVAGSDDVVRATTA